MSNPPSNDNSPDRRLVSGRELARYLGYKSNAALRSLPIKPTRITAHGPGSAVRYDLRAVDAWLDEQSGISTPHTLAEPANDLDAAFEEWRQGREAQSR